MKNFSLVLMFLFVFVAVSFAQNIRWTEGTEYDFGQIKQNDPAITTFEFENVGEEEVAIYGIKPSCRCIKVLYSTEPIKQGEKRKIKVQFDTRNVGSFQKNIAVTISPYNQTVNLFISGQVIPE